MACGLQHTENRIGFLRKYLRHVLQWVLKSAHWRVFGMAELLGLYHIVNAMLLSPIPATAEQKWLWPGDKTGREDSQM